MAGGSSVCTFSPAAASRQSLLSFQKRLSGGRRSMQALGPGAGAAGGLGAVGGGLHGGALRGRGGLARRHAPLLMLDGVDVTPRALHELGFADERRPAANAWELLTGMGPVGMSPMPPMGPLGPGVHSAPSTSSGIMVTRDSSVGGTSLFGGVGLGLALNASVPASSALSVLSVCDPDDVAPSQFALPRPVSLKPPPFSPADTPVDVLLSETKTFSLLDQPSTTAPAGSEEAADYLLDNKRVEEWRTRADRTFNDVEVQTGAVWTRTCETNLSRVRRKNASAQASPWDIEHGEYWRERGGRVEAARRAGERGGCAYPGVRRRSPPPAAAGAEVPDAPLAHTAAAQPPQAAQQVDRRAVQRRRRVLRRTVLDRISSQRSLSLSDADTRSVDSKDDSREEAILDDKLRAVLLLPAFRRAALQMERVLAAQAFQPSQVLYRGLPESDPLAPDLRFEYRLHPLWRMECEWAAGRAVTCLTWSGDNPDLLAVGYGRYLQQDQATGLVCMWSAKNPLLPERLYRFASPVTALSFARTRPNLLAVGMVDGGLALLDVSATDKSVVADAGDASESGVASPSWEPIWTMVWMSGEEFHLDDQVLVTAGQDGQVVRWRRGERGVEWTPMLRVTMAEGGEKGVPPLLAASGTCPDRGVGLRQFAGVLCMAPVPLDPVRYLVGTEDGRVHECSTNYLHQHKAVFVAHAGPVYRLSFSPFCEKIFLTCGADWTVRIWALGVNEPLVTLTGGMQSAEDASWSPRNSTVIASISGDELCMWDLRRKTYVPASRTAWAFPSPPTTLLFSPSQDNILVADRDGRVVAFALQDMPFAPYFQTKALVASLERALVTKPALLASLKKLGEPFV